MTTAPLPGPQLTVPGFRPEAIPAWARLVDDLSALARLGISTPCERDSAFTDDDPGVRYVAARSCQLCPAIDACRAFADANRETRHVWAGQDRTWGAAGYRRERIERTGEQR